MSLARIDVQQLAPDRWVVELECGSYSRRRRTILRARTFEETLAAVGVAYREQTAEPQKVGDAAVLGRVPTGTLGQDVFTVLADEPQAAVSRPGFDRITEQQITEAESLGLFVDRRWSSRRAQEVIDRKLAE